MFLGHLHIFFGEVSIQILFPFFTLGHFSFYHIIVIVLYIFWIQAPCHINGLKNFLLFWVMGCLFTLFLEFCETQNLKILMMSNLPFCRCLPFLFHI